MVSSDGTPRKRGRPKLNKSTGEDLPNGVKSGEENGGSSLPPRKRGRPKGSPNKKPKLMDLGDDDGDVNSQKRGRGRRRKVVVRDASNGITKTPGKRKRGRPRKDQMAGDGSQPVKRGRGRPRGSGNKKPGVYKVRGKVGRPKKVHVLPVKGKKRGRPRLQPAKRGRPRKNPLPSPEELNKPKVWKPLGRPRKYPRVDPPEGTTPTPRRSRGRPRKSESKKGAHLRKGLSNSGSPQNAGDGAPRKRGRPPSIARSGDDIPRKRGRPKGSFKNKATGDTSFDSTLPEAVGETPAIGMQSEAEVEREVELSTEHGVETEETLIDQDVSFDVSDQA